MVAAQIFQRICQFLVEPSSSKYRAALHFHYKLKCLSFVSKIGTRLLLVIFRTLIEELLARIGDFDRKEAEEGLSDQDRHDGSRIKKELMEITALEEITWRQKARLIG